MDNLLNSEQYLAGSTLFSDTESFLRDLSEDDELMIAGGRNSRSNSRPKRRRRRPKRRRRVVRRRNRSVSNS